MTNLSKACHTSLQDDPFKIFPGMECVSVFRALDFYFFFLCGIFSPSASQLQANTFIQIIRKNVLFRPGWVSHHRNKILSPLLCTPDRKLTGTGIVFFFWSTCKTQHTYLDNIKEKNNQAKPTNQSNNKTQTQSDLVSKLIEVNNVSLL